jgi:hypothetical protein
MKELLSTDKQNGAFIIRLSKGKAGAIVLAGEN